MSEPVSSPTSARPDETDTGVTRTAASDTAEYEIAWQVFGTKTVRAASEDDARAAVDEWLEDDHGLTSSVVDGWDYTVTGVR